MVEYVGGDRCVGCKDLPMGGFIGFSTGVCIDVCQGLGRAIAAHGGWSSAREVPVEGGQLWV